METFLRVAFWTVTLCCSCLSKSLPMSDSHIDYMRKYVTCQPDSSFYGPTDVEESCIAAALACFKKELEMAMNECESKDNIDPTVEFLEIQIELLNNTSASGKAEECSECETWPKTPFLPFLEKMRTLLEFKNAVLSAK